MKITFVLPSRSPAPIGAFRAVYELANRLVERGNAVAVVHPRTVGPPRGALARFKAALWVRRYRRDPGALAPWFSIDPRVRMLPVTHLDGAGFPDADALIAVTWEPPPFVVAAPPSKGSGFYFIQEGVPLPVATPEKVELAWSLPLHKIVISGWLEEKAVGRGEGASTSRVAIGVDLDAWGVDVPVESRAPRVGAMLNPIKGEADVLSALELARERVPGMTAVCYGTAPPPSALPAWVDYQRLPDRGALRALYNSCSIFVQASREEGWGLPANEAMACGCALVTYDTGGSREYAFDGETARVVEPPGAEPLAAALVELSDDDGLRLELSRNGRQLVAGLSWERCTNAFERVLAERVQSLAAGGGRSGR
jgi:L-malate glycosyltransferase